MIQNNPIPKVAGARDFSAITHRQLAERGFRMIGSMAAKADAGDAAFTSVVYQLLDVAADGQFARDWSQVLALAVSGAYAPEWSPA